MKKCSKCKAELPLDNFYNSKDTKLGKTSRCKDCMYKKKKTEKLRHPNKKTCSDCMIEKSSKDFYAHKATYDGLTVYCKICMTQRSISSRFKLSKNSYLEMLSRGCDSCGGNEKLCIDHDHSCCPGQMTCGNCIRGVLCINCNTAEGFLKNSKRAEQLLIYMKKHNL